MKRTWDIEEVVEHFTLLPPDLELLANKTGATRLGFALLLKRVFPSPRMTFPNLLSTMLLTNFVSTLLFAFAYCA